MHEKNNEASESREEVFREIDSENLLDFYDKKKLLLGLKRHIWLCTIFILIFGGLASYYSYKIKNTYKAEAIILFQEEKKERDIAGAYPLTNLSLSTVMEMITMPKNLEAVTHTLGLDMNAKALGSMIKVPTPSNRSNLIGILCQGDNENIVVDIANALALQVVKSDQEFVRHQLTQALKGIDQELEQAHAKLIGSIQAIEDFKREHRYFEMDAGYNTLLTQVQTSKSLLQEAKVNYDRSLVEYENLKRQTAQLPEKVLAETIGGEANPLQARFNQVQSSLAEAKAKYTKNNPKVKLLQAELEEISSNMESDGESAEFGQMYTANPMKSTLEVELIHLQGRVRSSQKIKDELTQTIEKLEEDMNALPRQQMDLVKLLYAKETIEQKLVYLNGAAETTQVMLRSPKGKVEVYQLAKEAQPYKERLWIDLLPLIGIFFGALAGLSLGFVIEIIDPKFRTSEQLDLSYLIPCVLSVPEIAFLTPKNAREELRFFMRTLVNRLEKNFPQFSLPTTVSLTSAMGGEGKTCIAYEFACYQALLGRRVLLISCDPYESVFLPEALTDAKGMNDVVLGESELSDVVVKSEGVDICMLRNSEKHPIQELLRGSPFQSLWDELKKQYDLIVVDIPGVLEQDYATACLSMTEHHLYVIGSGLTRKKYIDQCMREFKRLKCIPLGLILNRIDVSYIDDMRIKKERRNSKKRLFRNLGLFGKETPSKK